MRTPKDCRGCTYQAECRSYYGGSLCKHSKEINRAAVAAILGKEGA